MRVLVAGGSGFIGARLCARLDDDGHRVTAASRSPDAARLPDGVETVPLDITDDAADVVGAVEGHDAVVNLVALPSHVRTRRSHEEVHLGGTERLVGASEAAGVGRFVQMSGLGVDSGVETAYFDAKRRAEAVVRDSGVPSVVYRPSVVFGDGCAFLPFLRRVTPPPPLVAPLPGADTRLQPVWVDDLVAMVAAGVTEAGHEGETYEVGGPEVLTLAEMVRTVRGVGVLPLPRWLVAPLFLVAGALPLVPFGMDQYRVLGLDNTVADNDAERFVDTDAMLTLGEYVHDRE